MLITVRSSFAACTSVRRLFFRTEGQNFKRLSMSLRLSYFQSVLCFIRYWINLKFCLERVLIKYI